MDGKRAVDWPGRGITKIFQQRVKLDLAPTSFKNRPSEFDKINKNGIACKRHWRLRDTNRSHWHSLDSVLVWHGASLCKLCWLWSNILVIYWILWLNYALLLPSGFSRSRCSNEQGSFNTQWQFSLYQTKISKKNVSVRYQFLLVTSF